MPQVPYNPVPEAMPSTQATPTRQLNTKNAFGQSVAGGLDRVADGMARMAQGADALARGQERLAVGMGEEAAGYEKIARGQEKLAAGQALFGRALEGAGTEIFGRAVALQNLVNDADARDATTQYMMKVADLHAAHNALQGRAAADALPKFKEDLVNLRKEIRGSLKNPMAQKLYDSESQGTMSRTMFSAADHAGRGLKQHDIASREASITYRKNAPYADINDPVEFATRRDELLTATYELGVAKTGNTDPNSDIHKAAALLVTSEQRLLWLNKVAETDPFKAAQLLTVHDKELTEPDRDKIEAKIRTRSRAIGAANLGRDVWLWGNADPNHPKSLADMNAEVERRSDLLDKNDQLLKSHALAALNANYMNGRRGKIDADRTNIYTVNDAIAKPGVKTEQDLRTDPNVAAAIDALPPTVRNNIPARINSVNAARDKVTNERERLRIDGIMRSDKEAFLDLDIPNEKGLSAQDMVKYQGLQLDMKNKPREDPRVMRAHGWLRQARGPEMAALQIDRFTDNKAQQADYYVYLGTLSSALDVWQENHPNQKITKKEVVEEIGPQVITGPSRPWISVPEGVPLIGGKSFGKTSTPFYQQPLTTDKVAFEAWSQTKKEEVLAAGGNEPSDQELVRVWTREKLRQLYSKPKASQ